MLSCWPAQILYNLNVTGAVLPALMPQQSQVTGDTRPTPVVGGATWETSQSKAEKTQKNKTSKGRTGCTKSPCKMAGQCGDFQNNISHYALHAIIPSPPPVHAHTNNSLASARLPDGDSGAKIRKMPLNKDKNRRRCERKRCLMPELLG